MQQASQLTEFGKVFIFLVMGIIFVCIAFFVSRLIAPNKSNPVKLSSYECGEEPTGSSWTQLNSGFYIIALIFLLFDVEMVFIFPWATVFAQEALLAQDSRWGWFSFIEMLVFAGILILGLVYAWVKGDLEWVKSKPQIPEINSAIPLSAYTSLNQEVYKVKDFEPFPVPTEAEPVPVAAMQQAPATPRPAFKRVFKKPSE